jgi:hypothetical protein
VRMLGSTNVALSAFPLGGRREVVDQNSSVAARQTSRGMPLRPAGDPEQTNPGAESQGWRVIPGQRPHRSS